MEKSISSKTNAVNESNCEIITTTIPGNKISIRRKKNIIKNFQDNYNFHVNFIKGEKYDKWGKKEQFESTLNMLEAFKHSNYEYGIICQDDYYPIDNFLQELNKTISVLPHDWECLHLCPGILWGRRFRDKTKIGQCNFEYKMDNRIFKYHDSGRYFTECNPIIYYINRMWLGGPVAFVIKKSYITEFIKKYRENYDHDDRTLVKILDNKTFICRNPQLGYEEQCGDTSIKFNF